MQQFGPRRAKGDDGFRALAGCAGDCDRSAKVLDSLAHALGAKRSDLIATVKKHGSNKQNEDWYGSERRGVFAAFPTHFPTAKVFYDLRLDLRIEHLPILRGYGPRRRGEDNERDAATRSLRGGCAAEAAPPLAAHPFCRREGMRCCCGGDY